MKPLLAITLGDPAGCGPWVGAKAALSPRLRQASRPLLVGDASVLQRISSPRFAIKPLADLSDYLDRPGVANVLHVPHPGSWALTLGKPQRLAGEMAIQAIRTAVALALSGKAAAVVTGPVSKESFKAAGSPFPGHTEMLASLSGAGPVDMVMAAGDRRALLLTRHMPLRDVPGALKTNEIVSSVSRVNRWARQTLGIRRPSWAICGFNPHAGDRGLIGNEERRVIAPAVAALRRKGVRVEGPLPADSAWARHARGHYDFVACMYHDQGMIPLKTLAGRRLVNITAGLPFVRTSPGHGTAFDLAAGRPPYGDADPAPTLEACLTALSLLQGGKPIP